MRPIRVLVVDDSATMRMLISGLLEDAGIEVVGTAPNPEKARDMIKELNPDVVTLDVEMPGMSGIEFLEKIMRLRPMPCVMISTLTQKGADTSIEALRLGAVGCFGKPVAGRADAFTAEGHVLVQMVREAASAKVKPLGRNGTTPGGGPYSSNGDLVAIGASTGGVEALFMLLSAFPANCPPTVIVQHMPADFTASFARRLDKECRPSVVEATTGMVVAAGKVLIAPGGERHLEVGVGGTVRLVADDPTSGHRPSVDRMFGSVARTHGARSIGVLLTGMGADGAIGLKAMRDAGAYTIGQDEPTCVVYGMPRAAKAAGAVIEELPIQAITHEVLARTRAKLAA